MVQTKVCQKVGIRKYIPSSKDLEEPKKNRTPHHDRHYMDIIPISLSLAWRASSTKDEERLNLYRMHFSSKCLKKDQHNDVVRPFYHFRPSCDVIIMETWHILTCALSTQDWTKCYIGMFLMYSVFTTNIYRWKGKIIIVEKWTLKLFHKIR